MNRELKIGIAMLLTTAVLTVGFSYAATLKQKQYATHFVIGEGNLPDVEFGFFTDNSTEISEFTFNGLMPQSITDFTYTLKQKSSYNLTAYVSWGYSCLPISYLNIEMLWNSTQWSYTESKAWSTLDEIPITFRIIVGDNNNTAWDTNLIFTVSSTP
jgi:hypothetical protein